MTGNRRKRQIVNRRIQVGLAFRFVACLTAYLVLFGICTMGYAALTNLSNGPGASRDALGDTLQAGRVLLVPFLLALFCVALHAMVFLHRVAGPIYRLDTTLRQAAHRDISSDIHLRDGDHLTELAERYNEFSRVLRGDIGQVREDTAELRRAVESNPLKYGDLRSTCERIELVLHRYRLGDDLRASPESDLSRLSSSAARRPHLDTGSRTR